MLEWPSFSSSIQVLFVSFQNLKIPFFFFPVHQFINCLHQELGRPQEKPLIKPSLKCKVLATFPITSPGHSSLDKAGSTRGPGVRGLLSISEGLYRGLWLWGPGVGRVVYMIRTIRVLYSQKVGSWNPAWARPCDQSPEGMLT